MEKPKDLPRTQKQSEEHTEHDSQINRKKTAKEGAEKRTTGPTKQAKKTPHPRSAKPPKRALPDKKDKTCRFTKTKNTNSKKPETDPKSPAKNTESKKASKKKNTKNLIEEQRHKHRQEPTIGRKPKLQKNNALDLRN